MTAVAFVLLADLLVAAAGTAAEGRIVTERLHGRGLEGNLIRDTPDRDITIYLPPGYARDAARRFPVLYLLHGMTSAPGEWLDGSYQGFDLRRAMDDLAAKTGVEYLVVMPAADNSFGGSFYVNSAAFGRWEDFIVTELVRHVDGRYRTIASREGRGIAGQSMGGFGALYLADRHPDLFASVYALSPCCLGFVGELSPDAGVWTAAATTDPSAIPQSEARTLQRVRTMAAAFAAPAARSPKTGEGSPPAPMPFAPDSSGTLHPNGAVLRAWRLVLPIERIRRDPGPFRRLSAIGLEFGASDQIASVPLGTTAFARELDRAGIRHALVEFSGGHVDRAREGFETRLLPFFARAFQPAAK